VSILGHIQCHLAWAHLFPDVPGLQYAVRMMLNVNSIDVNSISDETLNQCLEGTGLIVEDVVRLIEAARKLVAEKN
jgi:hypothetical protein